MPTAFEHQWNDQHYRVIFDNLIAHVPHFIFWKNCHSTYLGCNQNYARLLGFRSPADILGHTDHELWQHSDMRIADFFQQRDQEVICNRPLTHVEQWLVLPNEKRVYISMNKLPLLDKHGVVVGILGIATDITEQKQHEQTFAETKVRAEKGDLIKNFVRNMQHDIRTPFNGVWGMANILMEREDDAVKKSMLVDIAHCAKELLDYCNSIMDFSKVENGELPLFSKKFAVRELIDSVIRMELPAAQLKNLELRCEIADVVPLVIIGDSYRLQRILINLVSNAIKFTKQGHVKVNVHAVQLNAKREIILQFRVEDTGIGIPSDKCDIIYERFSRVIPSNQGSFKGQGLGLRIVKQFVEEMDGEIEVRSEENGGTTFLCSFQFKLPLVNELLEQQAKNDLLFVPDLVQ